MITREQVIEMARECGFGIAGGFVMPPHAGHISSEFERIVHAAYKRGVEDSAKFADVGADGEDPYCCAPVAKSIAEDIRKLLEDTCTTS